MENPQYDDENSKFNQLENQSYQPKKNNEEANIKPQNTINWNKIIPFSVITALLNITAFIYEISYEAPNYIEILLKQSNVLFSLSNDSVQIPIFNRFMFFVETFISPISTVALCYFILGKLGNYPRITKALLAFVFFTLSTNNPKTQFPFETTLLVRSLLNIPISVCLFTVFYYIYKDEKQKPNSLVNIFIKSMIWGFGFLTWNSLLLYFTCKSNSMPVEDYLRDHPEFLEPIRGFCEKFNFSISNILVDVKTPGAFYALTVQSFFKRFHVIVFSQMSFQKCADGVSGTLHHEIVHTEFIDIFMKYLFLSTSFFIRFLFTDLLIIPNLYNYKFSDYISQGMKLATLTKILEYGNFIWSAFREEMCDTNALSTPESAVGFLKYLAVSALLTIENRNFRSIGLAHQNYSLFSTHPSTLKRFQRICETYPELVEITVKYSTSKKE